MPILKASLHLHTHEDPEDGTLIKYTARDLINQAKQLDFQVLALTLHNRLYFPPEIKDYAAQRGITLLPGIEISLQKSRWHNAHVLIIGAESLPSLKTLAELKAWRKNNPQPLVMAPHPNFLVQSLGLKTLKRNAEIFDAVEHSWFYTKLFNQNRQAARVAKKLNKPLVATSDMHDNRYLKDDYCLINCQSNRPTDIIAAIKKGQLQNVSRPKEIIEIIKFVWRFIKPRPGKKL
ncbi:MAG TPA: PHP domain-containing protein [bacterium]|nr:PHP domain-containing protein [bacterium]HPT29506.1 PHP domain-containing protein [bacterium]